MTGLVLNSWVLSSGYKQTLFDLILKCVELHEMDWVECKGQLPVHLHKVINLHLSLRKFQRSHRLFIKQEKNSDQIGYLLSMK